MPIFVRSQNIRPAITDALTDALRTNNVVNVHEEAESRSRHVMKTLEPEIEWTRFLVAVVIAFALLGGAIYTAKTGLSDISTALMTSFQSFSGLIVGLLSGEVAVSHAR